MDLSRHFISNGITLAAESINLLVILALSIDICLNFKKEIFDSSFVVFPNPKKYRIICVNKSNGIKNIIKNFLNNSEIKKKLNSSFYNLIKKVFSIISITSYENLHNWLKTKN